MWSARTSATGWPPCAWAAAWASPRSSSASDHPGGTKRPHGDPHMTESTTIRWEKDDTGVVTLVLDDPNQSANTMNAAFVESLAAVADRLEAEQDSIRGVVLTS